MQLRGLFTLIIASNSFAALPSLAQDQEGNDAEPLNCITLSSIEREQVAEGDHTIVYFMKDGRTYSNALNGQCPGLKRTGIGYGGVAFGRIPRICSGALVWPARGVETTPGPRCRLTKFQPVSESEADAILVVDEDRPIATTPVDDSQEE